MGRGIFIRNNSQWCSVKNIWVKQNGVWCPVKKVYVKINGQWCLCFPAGCDYTLTQFEWESPDYLWYSAGIDATKVGCFLLHQHIYTNLDTNESWLNIEFFDTDGNFIEKAYTIMSTESSFAGWPQCVKKIGNDIWFSNTKQWSLDGIYGFFTIPWDETLQSYPVDTANLICEMPYNWKVVERFDGEIFIGGLDGDSWNPPPPSPHSIFWYNNGSITKVVEIGGYSCGFDFDNEGNLWSGEYLLDEYQSHILPCRLGMWTKESVDIAINDGNVLSWGNANVIIDLGTYPNTDLNWGVSDVACDDRGNVYVSVNTYEQFDNNHEYGAVIKVYKDNEGIYQKEYLLLRDNTNNNNWDWFRSITVDGNYLILDVDHNQADPNSLDACQVIQI